MIASFSRNFIFVKPRKVGGTSLEIVLSAWCAEEDICSPISPEDEPLRAAFGGRPSNYRAADGTVRFYNHMPATEIQAQLPELWENAYKFTVERHPYEKVVSRAWWNLGRKGKLSALTLFGSRRDRAFSAEVDRTIASQDYLNYPLYCRGETPLVDEIWSHGQLSERLHAFAERIGVAMPESMPRAKGKHRRDKRSAHEILSKDQRDRIYADARFEFELMGFER